LRCASKPGDATPAAKIRLSKTGLLDVELFDARVLVMRPIQGGDTRNSIQAACVVAAAMLAAAPVVRAGRRRERDRVRDRSELRCF